MLAGLVLGLGLSAGLNLQRALARRRQRRDRRVAASPPRRRSPESPFVSVVDKTLPAVVFIDVRKKVGGGDRDDPQDEMMQPLLRRQPFRRHPQTAPTSGSGFIIDTDGRILTNNHVVRTPPTSP